MIRCCLSSSHSLNRSFLDFIDMYSETDILFSEYNPEVDLIRTADAERAAGKGSYRDTG